MSALLSFSEIINSRLIRAMYPSLACSTFPRRNIILSRKKCGDAFPSNRTSDQRATNFRLISVTMFFFSLFSLDKKMVEEATGVQRITNRHGKSRQQTKVEEERRLTVAFHPPASRGADRRVKAISEPARGKKEKKGWKRDEGRGKGKT